MYDELYPSYVEFCAVSQIRPKFARHGGSPGHAVMFLKGVCRDRRIPVIRVCDPRHQRPEPPATEAASFFSAGRSWTSSPRECGRSGGARRSK